MGAFRIIKQPAFPRIGIQFGKLSLFPLDLGLISHFMESCFELLYQIRLGYKISSSFCITWNSTFS